MTYDNYDLSPVYALNSYVWKLLQANFAWDEADYSAKPIIPVQTQPEMMQTGKAFIVYGSAIHPVGHLYAVKKSAIAYNIFSTNPDEATAVAALLADVFSEQDDAAAEVNRHIALEAPHRAAGMRKVSFTTIKTNMAEEAQPTDEENGYTSALVLVEAQYTQDTNIVKVDNFTYP